MLADATKQRPMLFILIFLYAKATEQDTEVLQKFHTSVISPYYLIQRSQNDIPAVEKSPSIRW